jgi:hypothetical protein
MLHPTAGRGRMWHGQNEADALAASNDCGLLLLVGQGGNVGRGADTDLAALDGLLKLGCAVIANRHGPANGSLTNIEKGGSFGLRRDNPSMGGFCRPPHRERSQLGCKLAAGNDAVPQRIVLGPDWPWALASIAWSC